MPATRHSVKLDYFNTLPARPEHVEAVLAELSEDSVLKLAVLMRRTGLTKTQTLCALQKLVNDGLVMVESQAGGNRFYRTNSHAPSL